MINATDTVLFQGDSITDCGRHRQADEPNDPAGLGAGYAHYAAAMLLADHNPVTLRAFNRGVGGDRIPDLIARWQRDALDLKPTVVSILVGINDIWHGLSGDPSRGVNREDFEAQYRQLLTDTAETLPGVRFVIGEPFLTPTGYATMLPMDDELTARRATIRGIADDHGAVFVPYQSVFDAAMDRGVPAEHLAFDGVHPTMAGHMLMARAWYDAVHA